MTARAQALGQTAGDQAACQHCGLPVPPGAGGRARFCCTGCEAAYEIIKGLDLGQYYARRSLDPNIRPLKPEDDIRPIDFGNHVNVDADGLCSLNLMVDGLHCAACVWLIETVLARVPGVVEARVNLSTHRLVLRWRGDSQDADGLAGRVAALGYRLVPFDPELLQRRVGEQEADLLRAMAVAGFAAANIMLLSVSIWAGFYQGMGAATRDLLHWLSALIAIPAIGFAGRPFFRSALTALLAGRLNMDVPISLAIILTLGMSIFETMRGGAHVYFDSAVMLLFFLLLGRYLDRRARGKARFAAERLLALDTGSVAVIGADGGVRHMPPGEVETGMTVLVASGERFGVDGQVMDGATDVDMSLINGESLPRRVGQGDTVFAGTVNLGASLRIAATAVGEGTVLAEMVRLMEVAEQGRAEYVALADRLSRYYAPAVHALALAAFLGWVLIAGSGWQEALLVAVSVLIVTCPCALGIAVPAVQIIASGRLLSKGILLKSATALERFARADTLVFDKTGTLTTGRAELANKNSLDAKTLRLAAAMCATSKHPLARAVTRAAPLAPVAEGVREVPGAGLVISEGEGEIRLGNRLWCGLPEDRRARGPELWLTGSGRAPVRFAFQDPVRPDAAAAISQLRRMGYKTALLSGDRAEAVADVADAVGIDDWQAECAPDRKVKLLGAHASAGHNVAMVGDGLNDAPALAAASVSLSPAGAADISLAAADAVFQGECLAPVVETLRVARKAERLVRQNFALAISYNIVTVPLAMAGVITPLFAAIAMSLSSLMVVGNALRIGRAGRA